MAVSDKNIPAEELMNKLLQQLSRQCISEGLSGENIFPYPEDREKLETYLQEKPGRMAKLDAELDQLQQWDTIYPAKTVEQIHADLGKDYGDTEFAAVKAAISGLAYRSRETRQEQLEKKLVEVGDIITGIGRPDDSGLRNAQHRLLRDARKEKVSAYNPQQEWWQELNGYVADLDPVTLQTSPQALNDLALFVAKTKTYRNEIKDLEYKGKPAYDGLLETAQEAFRQAAELYFTESAPYARPDGHAKQLEVFSPEVRDLVFPTFDELAGKRDEECAASVRKNCACAMAREQRLLRNADYAGEAISGENPVFAPDAGDRTLAQAGTKWTDFLKDRKELKRDGIPPFSLN